MHEPDLPDQTPSTLAPPFPLARADGPATDPVLAAQLAELVERLRAQARRNLLAHTLAVGRMLIDSLYGGSIHAYYAPEDAGHASFAALCRDHADALAAIGLPRDTLRLCIRAYDAWRLLPPATQEQLGPTQLMRLLRVHDPVTRGELAQRALDDGWTVRELDAEIAKEVAEENPARALIRAHVGSNRLGRFPCAKLACGPAPLRPCFRVRPCRAGAGRGSSLGARRRPRALRRNLLGRARELHRRPCFPKENRHLGCVSPA